MEALANWAWQGCAVTVAAAGVMRAWTSLSASTRYRLWWATLLIVLVLPIAQLVPGGGGAEPAGLAVPSTTTIHVPLPAVAPWPAALGAVVVSILLSIWAAWLIVSLWRIAQALVSLQRAKRAAHAFPAAREAQLRHWLAVRDRGRPASLVISDQVSQAAVLGLNRPVIGVAPHVLQALDDRELDQILVHEWAHVQRRDDLARLAQLAIVAVAGLHPAIWWIDRRLSAERETACDDWAVNLTGSAKTYAACLAKLASLAQSRPPLLLPAVSSCSVRTRIVRLLDRRRNTTTRGAAAATSTAVFVCALVAFAVASIDLVIAGPAAFGRSVSTTAARTEPAPSRVSNATPTRPVPASTPRQRVRAGAADLRTPSPPRFAPSQSTSTAPPRPIPAANESADATPDRARLPVAPAAPEVQSTLESALPGATTVSASAALAMPPGQPDPAAGNDKNPTPWGAAADAGVSVGRGSQKAAVATAGFFTRLGKSIARSF